MVVYEYEDWPFCTSSPPGRIEVTLEPECAYLSSDSCCCSSEVTLDVFRIVGMVDAKDRLDCRLGLPDYVDYRRSLRTAVMMPVSSWVPLVAYSAGHYADFLAEHCVARSAEYSEYSAVYSADYSVGYSAGHSADGLVVISGVAFAVVAAVIEEWFVVRRGALLAGVSAAEVQSGCLGHFVVVEDQQTSRNAPRVLPQVVVSEGYSVENLSSGSPESCLVV